MKVIIAEDDYRVSLIHEEAVNQMENMKVAGKALNGKELRALLSEKKVDLVLLDIYFPDITGTHLLAELRNMYPDMDIIIISASDSREDLLKAKRFGIYQFLIKPVSVGRLQQILNNYKTDLKWLNAGGVFNDEDAEYFLTAPYRKGKEPKSLNTTLPSGIDTITLNKITNTMNVYEDGVTIEVVCHNVGVSRTTARRYLEYLVSEGEAETKLSYGEIGRPERKYILKF